MSTPSTLLSSAHPREEQQSITVDKNKKRKNDHHIDDDSGHTPSSTSKNSKPDTEVSSLLLSELERCERELHSTRLIHGDESPKLAKTLNTLGLFHQHMLRNHDKAMMYHCETLRILNNSIKNSSNNNNNGNESSITGNDTTSCTTTNDNELLIAMGVALTDVAQIYEAKANNKQALCTYRHAKKLFNTIKGLSLSDPRIFSTKQGIDRLCRCTPSGQNDYDDETGFICSCYGGSSNNNNVVDNEKEEGATTDTTGTTTEAKEHKEETKTTNDDKKKQNTTTTTIPSNLYHSKTTEELLILGDEAMTIMENYDLASQYYRQAALKTPAISITFYNYYNPNSGKLIRNNTYKAVAAQAAAVAGAKAVSTTSLAEEGGKDGSSRGGTSNDSKNQK